MSVPFSLAREGMGCRAESCFGRLDLPNENESLPCHNIDVKLYWMVSIFASVFTWSTHIFHLPGGIGGGHEKIRYVT
jgi:hypothetical protein